MSRVIDVVFVIGSMVAGAAVQAAPAAAPRHACDLLVAEEIRAEQHDTVAERKPSDHSAKDLHFSQCVFATTRRERSVSLTVITDRGTAPNGKTNAVRTYWEATFGAGQKLGRKNPPRAVDVGGPHAFWTSDARAGALYVLSDEVMLRLSVGGSSDEDERLRRSLALAHAALGRLRDE